MSKYLLSSVVFLCDLAAVKNTTELRFYMNALSKSETLALLEIINNFLEGNIPVGSSEVKSLQKNKTILRKLKAYNSITWREAKSLLQKLSSAKAVQTLIDIVGKYLGLQQG